MGETLYHSDEINVGLLGLWFEIIYFRWVKKLNLLLQLVTKCHLRVSIYTGQLFEHMYEQVNLLLSMSKGNRSFALDATVFLIFHDIIIFHFFRCESRISSKQGLLHALSCNISWWNTFRTIDTATPIWCVVILAGWIAACPLHTFKSCLKAWGHGFGDR